MNFNYNTLQVTLNKESRSISIALNRPEEQNAINVEMLFELESLFGWLTSHLEVNAVVLTGNGDIFCNGFDQNELRIMSEEKFQKYIVRFQKIVTGMLSLPQTIICDLKDGARGMGIELALGADIRIARSTSSVNFNTLKTGWVPCCGGISLLSQWVGHSAARYWTMTSARVGSQEMINKGLIGKTYSTSEDALSPLLKEIAAQAPVPRIQAKRSFLEGMMAELKRGLEYETVFAFAAMKTEDWKKDPTNEEGFKSARDLAKELKKSLQPEPSLS
ncbi:MAG: enoyl-CoA hydratase/isomerase family protein [Bacteriovoracaceae bacterium]|nr:enoyl-CoA hydratase/isomerase family protein [Bacteriovoracaceae bacterium]